MSIDPGINEHEAYAVAEAFAAGRAMGHAEAREAVAALYMHAYPGEYGQLADALAAIDGVCPCGGVGSGCRCEKEKP